MPRKKEKESIISIIKAVFKKIWIAVKGFVKLIWKIIKNIFKAIWHTILHIVKAGKGIMIFIERSLKMIAMFMIVISTTILLLVTSFYLFSATFGMKESPAFQGLRDKLANIYVLSMEKDIKELEEEIKINK